VRRLQRLLLNGYEEWLGWGWLEVIHPDERDYTAAQWRHAVETHTLVNAEFRLHHVSGEWRNTWVRATPLKNPDGSVRGWIGMNLDLTEYERARLHVM
jgi:PAS domain S-box-containing protein